MGPPLPQATLDTLKVDNITSDLEPSQISSSNDASSDSLLPHAMFSESKSDLMYHVSKSHPPDLQNVEMAFIISHEGYNASQFLPALTAFLHSHGSLFTPHMFDRFHLWCQVDFVLPDIPEVGKRHHKNIIRAMPSIINQRNKTTGRRLPDHEACLDMAMIRTGEVNIFTNGTNLQGTKYLCPLSYMKYSCYV